MYDSDLLSKSILPTASPVLVHTTRWEAIVIVMPGGPGHDQGMGVAVGVRARGLGTAAVDAAGGYNLVGVCCFVVCHSWDLGCSVLSGGEVL